MSQKPGCSEEKGPAARRRPKAAGEAYFLYVEPAVEGANEADGPFSSLQRWLVAGAEVGLDHLGVSLDLGRRALGDARAVVEHGDPVGDPHDHLHLVLDEEHRQRELAAP